MKGIHRPKPSRRGTARKRGIKSKWKEKKFERQKTLHGVSTARCCGRMIQIPLRNRSRPPSLSPVTKAPHRARDRVKSEEAKNWQWLPLGEGVERLSQYTTTSVLYASRCGNQMDWRIPSNLPTIASHLPSKAAMRALMSSSLRITSYCSIAPSRPTPSNEPAKKPMYRAPIGNNETEADNM